VSFWRLSRNSSVASTPLRRRPSDSASPSVAPPVEGVRLVGCPAARSPTASTLAPDAQDGGQAESVSLISPRRMTHEAVPPLASTKRATRGVPLQPRCASWGRATKTPSGRLYLPRWVAESMVPFPAPSPSRTPSSNTHHAHAKVDTSNRQLPHASSRDLDAPRLRGRRRHASSRRRVILTPLATITGPFARRR